MNTITIGTNMTRMPLELKHPGLAPLEKFFPQHSFASFAGRSESIASIAEDTMDACLEAGDHRSDPRLPEIVTALLSPATELIIIDLIDERFNLAMFPGGIARPLTGDAIISIPEGTGYQAIATASSEHYQLWEAGWNTFLTMCDKFDLRDKLVIHECYLALTSKDGIEIANAPILRRVNAYLSTLYDRIRLELGTGAFATSGTPETTISNETGPSANPLSTSTEFASALVELVESKLSRNRHDRSRAQSDVISALLEAHTAVDMDSIVVHRGPTLTRKAFALPGLNLMGPQGTRAQRQGEHSIRIEVPFPVAQSESNLLGIKFKVDGFEELSMSYVGDVVSNAVRGLRFRHLLQDVWHTEVWSFLDPAYLISNRWPFDEPRRVNSLVLELNGQMIPGEASVVVDWVVAAQGESLDKLAGSRWDVPDDPKHLQQQDEAIHLLRNYLKTSNPFYEVQAKSFMETGRFPVYQGDQAADWAPGSESPFGAQDLGTYRYLHHSLSLATSLLLVAGDRKDISPAIQARDLANQWLDSNFFSRPEDPIYAWYDHGTPMRVLALLLLWHTFREQRDEDYRFFSRIESALDASGHILASEAFYAQYQPVRHQNHAWFQDIGLIALAAMRGSSAVSERWAEIGIRRLDDQFTHLIVDEGEYAIWSENSLGYHFGLISLIRFSRQIVGLLGRNPWPDLTERMNAWSTLVRYPDHRFPAIGDTIPAASSLASGRPATKVDCGAYLWETAGYAMAAGAHEGSAFRIFQVASSVNLVHKQNDNGSFTLWFDGVEWLVDPGLISYDPDDGPAVYARGPWAHNAVVVPGRPYSIEPGLCTLSGSASDDSFTFTTKHSSFEGSLIERTISGDLASLVVNGTDRAAGESLSDIFTVFHAGPEISIEQTDNGLRLRSPHSKYSLIIDVQGDCTVVSGWNGDERNSSIQSSGLASWVPTTSALVRHPTLAGLKWEIRAEAPEVPIETQCDHGAAGLTSHLWTSATEFTDSPELSDGTHSIRIDDSTHLDIVIRDLPSGPLNAPLVVFFAGAVTKREQTRPPFFAGNGLTKRLQIPWISLSDPIFQLDPKTTLGWYAGQRDSHLQDVITSLLKRLSSISSHGLLLVGGSGGGFASLYYASRVGATSRALVWNPQIEILDYAQGAVNSYLEAAAAGVPFPPLSQREALTSELKRAGVDHIATGLRNAGGFLILQNASDYHVIAQLAPLIRRESFPLTAQGTYGSDAEHILQLENWGTGHDPLPIEDTELVLRSLLNGASMQAAGEALRERLAPSAQELRALPRDMSDERSELDVAFQATVTRVDPSTVSVAWKIAGRDRADGGMFVNVLSVGESSPPVRLAGDLAGLRVDAPRSLDAMPYRVVLRDGFGTIITMTDVLLSKGESLP